MKILMLNTEIIGKKKMICQYELYDSQALRNAIYTNTGYSFSFGTSDPAALNLVNGDFLMEGYRYNLTRLKKSQLPLQATQQVEMLYDASTLVDHLWIQRDPSSEQIIGSWPGN